jgi:hypothetical protein
VDDVDPEGEDLAVDWGPDLGGTPRLIGQLVQLPAGVRDGGPRGVVFRVGLRECP